MKYFTDLKIRLLNMPGHIKITWAPVQICVLHASQK